MTRRWVERCARAGFVSKGAIYLIFGGLALQAALGYGGRVTDPRGALTSLLDAPFGPFVLGLLAFGLAFYAAWRFLEAFADANRKGRDSSGMIARAEYALSGAIYGVLAVDAGILAFSGSAREGDSRLPFTLVGAAASEWVVLLVAVGLIGYGLRQIREATSRHVDEDLNVRRVSREAGNTVVRVCRIGIASRAVVLVLMGVLLWRASQRGVSAASQTDPGDSLRLLSALPNGRWLLAIVAAGLMGYGVFQLVHARYRRITPP